MSDFQLKFQEQIDFLQQKVNLPTESYKEITSRQHDRAFVVAGAMKADLLNDLHSIVNQAIADGQSFKQFQDGFDDILAKHGWLNDEDKGYKAWRAKVIYQTNLRTSQAAGRYKQMTDPEMLKRRPYWRYRHNTVENPRIQHERWNNLVLPADADFWKTNFPPNGYGCNCTVDAINERQLKAMGKTQPDEEPAFDDAGRQDFNSAPGASWYPDLDKYPEPVAKSFVAENMGDGVFDRFVEHTFDEVDAIKDQVKNITGKVEKAKAAAKLLKNITTSEQYPIAVLSADQKQLLGASTQVLIFKQADAVQQIYNSATGLSYMLQHLFDKAEWIVRVSNNKLLVHVVFGQRKFIAEVQQNRDGLFLKYFNTASASEISAAKKSGTVLLGA
jgi:soluble cytochrome b562